MTDEPDHDDANQTPRHQSNMPSIGKGFLILALVFLLLTIGGILAMWQLVEPAQ